MAIIRHRRTERPPRCRLNKGHPYAGAVAFLGVGEMGFGSGVYADSSMFRNHGALTNYTNPAASWSRALGRASLIGNGSTNYITIPTLSVACPFTLLTWLKASNSSCAMCSGPSSNRWLFAFGALYMTVNGGSASPSYTLPLNAWHHFAVNVPGGAATTFSYYQD